MSRVCGGRAVLLFLFMAGFSNERATAEVVAIAFTTQKGHAHISSSAHGRGPKILAQCRGKDGYELDLVRVDPHTGDIDLWSTTLGKSGTCFITGDGSSKTTEAHKAQPVTSRH